MAAAQTDALLAENPTLAQHACRQQGVGCFGDKIASASLPHIVEHLAIDYLVAGYGQPVAGNTVPGRQADGGTQVRLQVPADMAKAAEAAIRQAVDELNRLLSA